MLYNFWKIRENGNDNLRCHPVESEMIDLEKPELESV